MPDPFDSADGQTHSVGDGCDPPHHPLIVAAHEFAHVLVTNRWKDGVRIVVQGAMQTVKKDVGGKVAIDMHASWRADVFFEKRLRRANFTLVSETPALLFKDLAGLCEQLVDKEDG